MLAFLNKLDFIIVDLARLSYGTDTLCGLLASFMKTWTIYTGQARTILPNTTFLGTRSTGREVRCWAHPCSLAATKGILVSFFSSAY